MKTIEKPKKNKNQIKGTAPKYTKNIKNTQTNQGSEQLWRAWRVTQMARTRFLICLGSYSKHRGPTLANHAKSLNKPKKTKISCVPSESPAMLSIVPQIFGFFGFFGFLHGFAILWSSSFEFFGFFEFLNGFHSFRLCIHLLTREAPSIFGVARQA